jgi:hypothetical protein
MKQHIIHHLCDIKRGVVTISSSLIRALQHYKAIFIDLIKTQKLLQLLLFVGIVINSVKGTIILTLDNSLGKSTFNIFAIPIPSCDCSSGCFSAATSVGQGSSFV